MTNPRQEVLKVWERLKVNLKKPKTEQAVQTDLTAEQISQMEKDLVEQTTKIAELQKEQNELTNQITQKETEIEHLKEQTKGLKLNPTEERFVKALKKWGVGYYTKETYQRALNFLNSGKIKAEVWDLTQLSETFKNIRTRLISVFENLIKLRELEEEAKEETEIRQQLQTKYDMEARSKGELVKELEKERGWWDKWVEDKDEKQNSNQWENRPLGSFIVSRLKANQSLISAEVLKASREFVQLEPFRMVVRPSNRDGLVYEKQNKDSSLKDFKLVVKFLSEYYKSKAD